MANSMGTFCEYQQSPARTPDMFDTFEQYFYSLSLDCPDEPQSGVLTWTPNGDTPDLLYYQVSPVYDRL